MEIPAVDTLIRQLEREGKRNGYAVSGFLCHHTESIWWLIYTLSPVNPAIAPRLELIWGDLTRNQRRQWLKEFGEA